MRSVIALELSVTPVMIIQVAKRNASASGPAPGSASMANVIVSRCLFDVREGQSAIGIGDTDDLIELCYGVTHVLLIGQRLALGSDAFDRVRTALTRRLAELDAQEQIARLTEIDDDAMTAR